MKKLLLSGAMFFAIPFLAQNELKELRNDVDNIKLNIKNLQSEIQSVKSENIYLKQVLNINKPILEQEKANTNFRITKVEGNKAEKTIYITVLAEVKDNNKETNFRDLSIIDIEGNEVKVSFLKSSDNTSPKLAVNVPQKIVFAFPYRSKEEIFPKIVKLFRFRYVHKHLGESDLKRQDENLEFRDLNVEWK